MKHDDCHDYSSYNECEWNGFFLSDSTLFHFHIMWNSYESTIKWYEI